MISVSLTSILSWLLISGLLTFSLDVDIPGIVPLISIDSLLGITTPGNLPVIFIFDILSFLSFDFFCLFKPVSSVFSWIFSFGISNKESLFLLTFKWITSLSGIFLSLL